MMKHHRRNHGIVLTIVVAMLFGASSHAVEKKPGEKTPAAKTVAKNVIVLIVDGCGADQYTLLRWYQGRPLALDAIRVGAVQTHLSDSIIADSAPTSTAYATGFRSGEQIIGLSPRKATVSDARVPKSKTPLQPLANVLEGARLKGKATGIVSTSAVTHATPAAFVSHAPSRFREGDIMEQAVYQNVDVVLGGGRRYLVPKEQGGRRTDGENLLDYLKKQNYRLPTTAEQLAKVESGRIFGMFAESHMSAEIDRPHLTPEQPSLLEMTKKAVELLSKDPDGFFLMVEASEVDWACHANDPGHLVSDLAMYDKVVAYVLDFARREGNTLVLATSDHNTGGPSIGNRSTDSTYGRTPTSQLVDPIKKMKRSAFAMWRMVRDDPTVEKVKDVVAKYWGMTITDDEAARIIAYAKKSIPIRAHEAFGVVLCPKYTILGWTSCGHTGGDVPLHAFGPGSPTGVIDGPEIGRVTAAALGLDLNSFTKKLFVDLAKALPGAKITLERRGTNEVIQVVLGNRTAELPINKNLITVNGTTQTLDGVVLCIRDGETQRFYVPAGAINIFEEKW